MGNSEKRELLVVALPDKLSEALDLSQWLFGPREQNKPAPPPIHWVPPLFGLSIALNRIFSARKSK